MKARKLVLCILLSVALTVTFIPVMSYADEDDPHPVSFANVVGIDLYDDEYEIELDHGWAFVNSIDFTYDSEDECFYVGENGSISFRVGADSGWEVAGVQYKIDNEEWNDAYTDGEGWYKVSLPVRDDDPYEVIIQASFIKDQYNLDAEYFGEPVSITICPDGENVDITPAADDYIIIHKNDGDVRCEFKFEYDEESGDGWYNLYDTDETDNNYIDDWYAEYVSPTQIEIRIIGYCLDNDDNRDYWGASVKLEDVEVYNEVEKIVFVPATTSVYSEDIKSINHDGEKILDLDKRSKHSAGGETWYSMFAVGDKITVYYDDNRTKTYVNKNYYDTEAGRWCDDFFCGDDWIYVYMWTEDDLVAGKNSVIVEYHGCTTTFNLTVETPESRAAEAARKAAAAEAAAAAQAEAARQGVYSGSMPAVKASKPKAAKKAITVKWKKLKKKQFKSGVSKIEVWVSTNTAFARGATIEKTVGKKKASIKIKGLQKGVTYYAKVRSIKYVNGQKVVGKWSGVKKVKVKK